MKKSLVIIMVCIMWLSCVPVHAYSNNVFKTTLSYFEGRTVSVYAFTDSSDGYISVECATVKDLNGMFIYLVDKHGKRHAISIEHTTFKIREVSKEKCK